MALAEAAMAAAGSGWCSAMAAVGGGPCRAPAAGLQGARGCRAPGAGRQAAGGGGCRVGGNAGRGQGSLLQCSGGRRWRAARWVAVGGRPGPRVLLDTR